MQGNFQYLAGGVLAANGKIYFAPADARQVLSIDPDTQTVEMLGPEIQGNFKYLAGGVLAANGKIYFAPAGAHQVLSIDPDTQTVEMLGPEMQGQITLNGDTWIAGCTDVNVLDGLDILVEPSWQASLPALLLWILLALLALLLLHACILDRRFMRLWHDEHFFSDLTQASAVTHRRLRCWGQICKATSSILQVVCCLQMARSILPLLVPARS